MNDQLESFTQYCLTHPSERFWQALRNWSGQNFILASNDKTNDLRDTFYWRNRDG